MSKLTAVELVAKAKRKVKRKAQRKARRITRLFCK